MSFRRLKAGLLITALLSQPAVHAEAQKDQAANPALWGYSGLMNVPTAEILAPSHFYTSLRYFPLNSGLSGVGYFSPLEDLEAGLIFGIPPANGFSALSGSLKYRVMNQAKNQPFSMALGTTLLGIDNNVGYIPGSNLFLTLSRNVYLPAANSEPGLHLLDLHAGFMGSLSGARLVGGLEIPFLDYGRLKLEYLGSVNPLNHAFNLGFNITPFPHFNIELALMQRPGSDFWNRDFILGLGYQGDFQNPFSLPTPSPTPVPQVSAAPTLFYGVFKLHVTDTSGNSLDGVRVRLNGKDASQPDFDEVTSPLGLVQFNQIPVGEYTAEISYSGWKEETRSVSIQKDLKTSLEVVLSPKSSELKGRILEANGNPVTPETTVLEIYDTRAQLVQKIVPGANGSYSVNLTSGTYTLKVLQNEKLMLETTQTVREGSTTRVLQLETQPLPQTTPSATPSPEVSEEPLPTPIPVVSATPAPEIAQILGKVKDHKGQPLSGVRLRLELEQGDLMVLTLTGAEGNYAFRDIPKGTYILTVSRQGFKNRRFKISMSRIETINHDFEMKPEEQ